MVLLKHQACKKFLIRIQNTSSGCTAMEALVLHSLYFWCYRLVTTSHMLFVVIVVQLLITDSFFDTNLGVVIPHFKERQSYYDQSTDQFIDPHIDIQFSLITYSSGSTFPHRSNLSFCYFMGCTPDFRSLFPMVVFFLPLLLRFLVLMV